MREQNGSTASEEGHKMTEPDVPVAAEEGATLSELLSRYENEGFTISFSPTRDGELECGDCNRTIDPSAVEIASWRRLEGASDPADMLEVVGLTCPHCGRQGTATLGFGPAAAPEDGDILGALRDQRGSGASPRGTAPGEVTS